MPEVVFPVDVNKSIWDQEVPGHNRWHPDIPPVTSVRADSDFRMECLDWTGGQIENDDNPSDVDNIDLTPCHILSGPIAISGAEPGDLLVVDILDIGPGPWGYTGIFSKRNGGGFLTDHYPEAYNVADSDGIRIAGGYVGIVDALIAWYLSAALIINAQARKEILPIQPYPYKRG